MRGVVVRRPRWPRKKKPKRLAGASVTITMGLRTAARIRLFTFLKEAGYDLLSGELRPVTRDNFPTRYQRLISED